MIRMFISYCALISAGLCLFQIQAVWDKDHEILRLPSESWKGKIKGSLVVIDAGHGGVDGGTQGHGILEKQVTLEMARLVEKKLTENGIRVIMTRGVDVYVELGERSATANRNQAALFVSLHMNADATSMNTNGVETYYCNRKRLGDINKLRTSLDIPTSRSFKDIRSEFLAMTVHRHICEATGANDRKIRDSNYLVIMQSECPAILVECGYITNETEALKLQDAHYKDKLASALADGIISYLSYAKNNPRRGIIMEAPQALSESLPVTVTNP